MDIIKDRILKHKNYFFVGEAGSGKSEIAINYAIEIKKHTDKEVHFFDLDMTKPLFRSSELEGTLKQEGIVVHFEEQFFDAPTVVGGVRTLLKDENAIVVLDIGGDYIGARTIGGFAKELNKENCLGYYVINSFRPWSMTIENIDRVLGSVLGVSHVQLDRIEIISNPNMGPETTLIDIIEGHKRLDEMVSKFKPISFVCCIGEDSNKVKSQLDKEVFPLNIYLNYPWNEDLA